MSESKKPAVTSDSDYKLLFSCPEIVRDLLTGYTQENG